VIANNSENIANFGKVLDGKPLFIALYGMHRVTLNEMKAVLKLSAQAR
jgi:septal ring-binding cell division protein DamX